MPRAAYLPLLRRWGFSSFLLTQFLGALNDNLLKWTLIFLTMAGMARGASAREGANLAAISNLFVLPTLLFSGLGGWMADRWAKRRVLIAVKACEMGIMLLAWAALRAGWFPLQLAVLFLLATQFALFSPAKYGVLPELAPGADLAAANGLVEMSTFAAILLGSSLSAPLFHRFRGDLGGLGWVLVGLAALGSLASLGIGETPEPTRRRPLSPRRLWSEIVSGTRILRRDPGLWAANAGVCYFWFAGALVQLAVVLLGTKVLGLGATGVAALGVVLAAGVGLGSLLAGRLAPGEGGQGLAPWGALGMGLSGLALGWAGRGRAPLAWAALAGVGVSAGVFVVPLNALLQRGAPPDAKGRVMAANNFLGTLAMVPAALLVDALDGPLGPGGLIALSAAGSLAVAAAFLLRGGGRAVDP